MVKVRYEFVSGSCDHQHPFPEALKQDNPFLNGWERCVIAFHSQDWFSGPVNLWLKEECAKLGIEWVVFVPRSKPSEFMRILAREQGATLVEVSDDEHERSYDMWAVLQQGASIFEDVCVSPSCVNYDEMAHILPRRVDVEIHAPTPVVEQVLSDLFDWNHEV